MSLNILSILLSLAMMLTGAAGLETDVPMANTLTIRNVTLDYNGEGFTLEPSLTAGVMTDNGTAVYDFSMTSGDKNLFPMQLVITEEAATLVFEKTGQAFSVSADDVNAMLSDALELDKLTMDEETREAFEMLGNLFSAEAQLIAYTPDYTSAYYETLLTGLDPVDTTEGTITYENVDYAVTQRHYVIDNDQFFQLAESVYASNEDLKSFYDLILESYNETLRAGSDDETTYAPVASLQEIYAAMGLEMGIDLVKSTTDDEAFSCVNGTLSIMGEILPQPMTVTMDIYVCNGAVDFTEELAYTIDDTTLSVGAYAHGDEANNYFEMLIELMPEDLETATEEDYEDIFSFFLFIGSDKNESNGTNYSFSLEAADATTSLALIIDGVAYADNNSSTAVEFYFNDDTTNFAFGFTLDLSSQLFDNAAEGLEAVTVTPENIESISGDLEATLLSMMADLQTLAVEDSITDAIEFFTNVSIGEASTDATIGIIGGSDGPTAVYVTDMDENYDDEEPLNTELTFNEPEFTYLPEGMNIQDAQIDVAYNNASYTIADENNDNIIYAYIYGDLYTSGTNNSYILDASGVLTVIDGCVVSIEQDEDIFYVEMHDGDISVGLSCFGEDFTLETIGKILNGLTY